MTVIDNKVTEFLRELTFFSGLAEKDIGAFLEAANVRLYKKGESLFHQGDEASSFFVIISGWVKLFRNTADGEEALVSMVSRGDVFGEAALFTGSTYPLSAQAASECRVLVIPGSTLKKQAQKNPDITTRMLALMSREMTKLQRQNEHMALMSAPQRLGCLLLQLTSRMKGNGGIFTFPYDKSLAAAQLGMKPETFSRALNQLKPAGVMNKGVEIEIDSFSKLSAFSCAQCTALPGECSGYRSAACKLKRAVNA